MRSWPMGKDQGMRGGEEEALGETGSTANIF